MTMDCSKLTKEKKTKNASSFFHFGGLALLVIVTKRWYRSSYFPFLCGFLAFFVIVEDNLLDVYYVNFFEQKKIEGKKKDKKKMK